MMDTTYHLSAGKVVVKNSQFKYKYWLYISFGFLAKAVFIGSLFLGSSWVTKKIFTNSIEDYTLSAGINLGAIFSTFASAVISVVTLLCTKQLDNFKENVRLLQTELICNPEWKHWPFVRRLKKQKTAPRTYRYHLLKNAQITFLGVRPSATFPIPITYHDINDLTNIFYYIKMIVCRNQYSYYLSMHPSHDSDILVWDCLQTIYRNIIYVQVYQLFIWSGGVFIINSILFAFFYQNYITYIDYILHIIRLI